jgi:hypothetical protein
MDVADNRVDDPAYFAAITKEMENGGLAALIHDMLARDISGFEVRDIPATAALKTQKTLSLPSLERWWLAVLSRSFLWKSRHGAPWFCEWHEFYTTELLDRSYGQWYAEHRPYDRKSRAQLGTFFARVYQASRPRGEHPMYEVESIDRDPSAGQSLDKIAIVYQDHPQGYRVGPLGEARARFLELHEVDADWQQSGQGQCD